LIVKLYLSYLETFCDDIEDNCHAAHDLKNIIENKCVYACVCVCVCVCVRARARACMYILWPVFIVRSYFKIV